MALLDVQCAIVVIPSVLFGVLLGVLLLGRDG